MDEQMTDEDRASYWKDCYDRMAGRNKELSDEIDKLKDVIAKQEKALQYAQEQMWPQH